MASELRGGNISPFGVVVIARNEALTIGSCLEVALRAVQSLGGGPVVLVDSVSSDGTAGFGVRAGVRVIRVRRASKICPSAMRRIGAEAINSQYIMFLDGDCELVDGFLDVAIRRMEDQPDLGVLAGTRRDYYRTSAGITAAPENYYERRKVNAVGQPAYGGCALYRAEALRRSGSFDPFLGASEEEELSFRIRKAGFKIEVMDAPMIRHITVPRESSGRLLRTLRHGFFTGRGQAARLFLSRGLIGSALHGLDRPLATLLHLILGLISLAAWGLGTRWPLTLWLALSAIAALAFLVRTKSPRRVVYYVAEWLVQGAFLIVGFLAPRRRSSEFKWEGEVYEPDESPSARLPRVLLVGPCPPPPLRGGVEKGVALLLESPTGKGTSMRVFNNFRPRVPGRMALERVHYQWGKVKSFYSELHDHPVDLVHVKTSSGINFHQNALFCLVSRLSGVPVLLQIHCGKFEAFYNRSGRAAKAWIRWHLSKATRVAVLSDAWRQRILGIAPHSAVTVVPNGLSESEMRSLMEHGPRSKAQILFLGTGNEDLDREKGLEDLVFALPRVMRERPEASWVLAGLGDPEKVQAAITRDCPSAALARERVSCMGIVTDEERLKYFRQSSILVLPSYFENMPNVLLEAMAAGMGIIATDVGAVREMLQGGRGGLLITPGDREALEKALMQILENKCLAEEQGEINLRAVQTEYTMSVVQQRLEGIYRELARWPKPFLPASPMDVSTETTGRALPSRTAPPLGAQS